ncbi:MAG TPA: penicillin acylase family protein [Verrucomicrobiota bacterium]|nr:penicillin acylase family protein [Verrucomicrobiota bacterium]
MKKGLLRWVGVILVVLAVALVGGTVWLWLKVRSSLPDLDGVNAGLASLGAAPPEYLLLRSTPHSWLPEDSILVGYAMFVTLQESDGAGERSLGVLRELLPAEAFAFFAPIATDWDAAVDGTALENAPMPSANVFSFESSRLSSPARRVPGMGEGGADAVSSWRATPQPDTHSVTTRS